MTESFWRSWDYSLSESLLYYCIFYSTTRGTSYFGGLGLKGECTDSRIMSMINFDLNLIMNAFFGNKAKDAVVIRPREIKSLVSSCLKWRELKYFNSRARNQCACIHWSAVVNIDIESCVLCNRAEKRLRKSMSCGNDCGLRRGLVQNGGHFAGKKQPEFKMKK